MVFTQNNILSHIREQNINKCDTMTPREKQNFK